MVTAAVIPRQLPLIVRDRVRVLHHGGGRGDWFSCRFLAVLVLGLAVSGAPAADWPMYRADPGHTGYTAEPLPSRLRIRWVRKNPPPSPAWSGRDTRMPYDHAYQPVAVGGLVFWGSSTDCSVCAVDAASGVRTWVFFTEGPVRFAPAAWKDRLFVVSDDGFLYCLSMADGTLLWKKRGGPGSNMLLGNGRLISRWPARGGPVVSDDIVYFGAGIWPAEGIYLYALDAATGKVVWVNDSSGGLTLQQPHGGNRAESGVSIQGYLAIAGESLIVPTGRATPALYNLASGAFLRFHLMKQGAGWGRRKGAGPFITAIDEHFFIAEDDVFRASDGGYVTRGLPVSSTAVTPEGVVFSRGNEIRGIGTASLFKTTKHRGKTTRTLGAAEWRIECADPVGSTVIRATASNEAEDWPNAAQAVNPPLVVAGNTIVAATPDNRIVIADRGSKKVVNTIALDAPARGLAVADKALYAATTKGTMYCLAGTSGGTIEHREPIDPKPYKNSEPYTRAAANILETAGFKEGYCVDLACGDGALACALAKSSNLHIIAVEKDPSTAAAARGTLAAAGLYGSRVIVLNRDPADTGLIAGCANLVVSGRSVTDGAAALPAEETARLLHPYNGVAIAGTSAGVVTRGSTPEGAGEWTHQYADAANTLCSADDLARAPLRMVWFKDFGFPMPSRHGRGPAPLCKDGIMIIEGIHGLLGVDARNGRVMWRYPIQNILKPYDQEQLLGTAGTGSNMCIAGDSVYVRHAGRCLRIDMETGTLIRTYAMPDTAGVWGYIACEGGILYGTSADRTYVVRQLFRNVSDMKDLLTQSKSLFALDVKTGDTKWVYTARTSIRHNAIAIGNGGVYLIDKPKEPGDLPKNAAKKKQPSSKPPRLLCLDADTGNTVWEQKKDIFGTTLALSTKHRVLLMCYQYAQRTFQLPSEKGDRLAGIDANDGTRLWDTKGRYISRPIINGTRVITQPYAYDLLTGTRDTSFKVTGRQPGGCGPLSGSTHLLLYRSGTLGYTDLRNNTGTRNYGPVRPGCWINAIVAGGLVLMPDATDRCTCSYLMKASVALAPGNQGGGKRD